MPLSLYNCLRLCLYIFTFLCHGLLLTIFIFKQHASGFIIMMINSKSNLLNYTFVSTVILIQNEYEFPLHASIQDRTSNDHFTFHRQSCMFFSLNMPDSLLFYLCEETAVLQSVIILGTFVIIFWPEYWNCVQARNHKITFHKMILIIGFWAHGCC